MKLRFIPLRCPLFVPFRSPAQVFYSIMAPGFPGVWQIDAEVPQNLTPGPAVPLVVSAGGVTSNTVTIAVQ